MGRTLLSDQTVECGAGALAREREATGVRFVWVSLGMLIPISLLALPILFWLIKRSARNSEPVRNGPAFEFVLGRGMVLSG